MANQRAHWGSRFGFVLAAAGSAVGLGNIWKFPYITGENGGGWFVLIYLVCIAVIGLPVMMAEIFLGRTSQKSPVGAFREMSRPASPWLGAGWLGVFTAFMMLSFYSIVAGWALHYVWLSVSSGFGDLTADQIGQIFNNAEPAEGESKGVLQDVNLNLFWHVVFMIMTIAIVLGGVRAGLERWTRILMPALFLMMLALLINGIRSDGFGEALGFVFGFSADKFGQITSSSVLEALGHAFFTLSLGMGAMITYGSYLKTHDDVVMTSVTVCVLDTVIALMACMVIFPIIFSHGMEPDQGPGLVFVSIPNAFSTMAGGAVWATVFFALLVFAALTSAISLLEVAASYFIDERGWTRAKAVSVCGIGVTLIGIPCAMSGGTDLFGARIEAITGMNWFDTIDYAVSNWMLPLGGLLIAVFVAWRVGSRAREEGFKRGTRFASLYWGWVQLLRFVVPIGVIAVLLFKIGVIS